MSEADGATPHVEGSARDHRWRCECSADHFLVITWNATGGGGAADASGEIGVEDGPRAPRRYRLAWAWQILRHGHSATGVSVQLGAAKAREIAAVLNDFADDASATPEDRERERRSRQAWDGTLARATDEDRARAARIRARADEQMAEIAPLIEEQRARRQRGDAP